MQNCLMLINRSLVKQTIEREDGMGALQCQAVRAPKPLFHGHINPYGQFAPDLGRPLFLEAA